MPVSHPGTARARGHRAAQSRIRGGSGELDTARGGIQGSMRRLPLVVRPPSALAEAWLPPAARASSWALPRAMAGPQLCQGSLWVTSPLCPRLPRFPHVAPLTHHSIRGPRSPLWSFSFPPERPCSVSAQAGSRRPSSPAAGGLPPGPSWELLESGWKPV